MRPEKSMFGWKMGVVNSTVGGLFGYSLGNSSVNLYLWPLYGVFCGPSIDAPQKSMFSPSGKAWMPSTGFAMSDIRSFWSLLVAIANN